MLRAQDASMADEHVRVQGQLFHELKKRFPEVPDSVVSSLMQQHGFIRERCIDALGRESLKYLNNGLTLPMDQLCMGESPPSPGPRGSRSDSVGSSGHISSPHTPPSSRTPGGDPATPTNDTPYSSRNYVIGPPNHQGAGDSQNGPYGYDTGVSGGAGWVGGGYQFPTSGGHPTIYNHGALIRPNPGGHSPYPPQAGRSGPASIPPMNQPSYVQRLSYDPAPPHPQRRGPPQNFPQRFPSNHPGYRTPSPQQPYSMFPVDYSYYRATSPASPAGSQASVGYQPQVSHQSFVPGLHTPTSASTSSPSGSLWYPPHVQPGASNTNPPFSIYTPPPWPGGYSQDHPGGDFGGRRGSEDTGYTTALLLHQQARMDKLRQDLETSLVLLENLKYENLPMEQEAGQRHDQRSSSFPSAEDVGKMREENRRLLIDCQLMTREIDMTGQGVVLLGVVDPQQQQSFYNNIGSTGQRGSIHAGGEDERFPIEEEGPSSRAPPARPPPPSVLPINRGPVASPTGPVTSPTGPVTSTTCTVTPPSGSATSRTGEQDPDEGEQWSCSACTFLNHPGLDRCEMCEMPRLNNASNPHDFS